MFMSQEIRNNGGAERDISEASGANGKPKNYEEFEGMNYEQVRQPFNPKHTSRTKPTGERKDQKRPDEG